MAEFRLGRLKFNWRGAWAPSTAFIIDDIVRYGAILPMCVQATTPQTPASTGFPNDSQYWDLHTEGQNYAGEFTVVHRICCKRYHQRRW